MKKKFIFIGVSILVVLFAVILVVNIQSAKADDGSSEPNSPPDWEWNGFTADELSFNKVGTPYYGNEIIINETPCSWTLVTHESWITVSPGSGTGGATATVSVSRNNSGSIRVGWIHVYDDGAKIADITVRQSSNLLWMRGEL